jgi:exonuclease SbcC
VRLNSLHLTNFRQHADTRIEFDLGLTGIIGPNGAGKSTVLEAIAWALYGQSAVRGTRDSIRNVRAGARAPVRVELDFDLSGHRYRVVRGLSSAELYLDGGSEPIATTITDVSDLLGRRLGMTRAEFFYTYFTGQKELSVMAAMAPTERAQFLSRVLGYDRIRAAQGLGRERRKLVGAEITGVKGLMPDPVGRVHAEGLCCASEGGRAPPCRRPKTDAESLMSSRHSGSRAARSRSAGSGPDLRLASAAEGWCASRTTDARARCRGPGPGGLESIAARLAPLSEVMDEYRMLDALAREEGRRRTLAESLRALSDELNTLRARQATPQRQGWEEFATQSGPRRRGATLPRGAPYRVGARPQRPKRDLVTAVPGRDTATGSSTWGGRYLPNLPAGVGRSLPFSVRWAGRTARDDRCGWEVLRDAVGTVGGNAG